MTSEEQRAVLAHRWEGMKLAVAHAHVEALSAFFRSMGAWFEGDNEQTRMWNVDENGDQDK
ncbi:MAG TPA: hypothetical protein VHX68_05720, partial [Planctomycetaceae bacterium]|nr:hypothetical protein [Planctomycetaceae bacterium]